MQIDETPVELDFSGSSIHKATFQVTRVVQYDDYSFSVTVIKPLFVYGKNNALRAFLFIPSQIAQGNCWAHQLEIAAELVLASGRAAIMIGHTGYSEKHLQILEQFAALRWLGAHGREVGINPDQIAVVGMQLGANVATVITMMALREKCPEICLQILIDPQFYISRKHVSQGKLFQRPGKYDLCEFSDSWLEMQEILNLPLDSKTNDLAGLPPTLVQLSKNTVSYCELDYYCTKLVHAGTEVIYITYDEEEDLLSGTPTLPVSKSMLLNAASELIKFS